MKRLLCLFFLSACTAAPQYYLLPEVMPSQTRIQSQKQFALRHVHMPDYLNQDTWLFHQEGEIIFSKQHKWLIPLSERIPDLIYDYLKSRMPFYRYPLSGKMEIHSIIDMHIQTWLIEHHTKTLKVKVDYAKNKGDSLTQTYSFQSQYPLIDLDAQNILKIQQQALMDLGEDIIQHLEH